MVLDITLDIIEKDGKGGEKYFQIKNYKHTYDLHDKSDVIFEGLLEDNPVLRKYND